jgi:NADH-quinone oxidoreductase subunit A
MVPLVAYALLFMAVGVVFIFIHLVIGKLIRPSKPDAEKKTIYECGEPTIGSAWIQFDLRFYVIALLFVIFDVEVAFFFPWAEVFGKANAIAASTKPTDPEALEAYGRQVAGLIPRYDRARYDGYNNLTGDQLNNDFERNREIARQLSWLALIEIAVFFGVLLVGFAYLWRRGDLAWVRSTLAEQSGKPRATTSSTAPRQAMVGASS